MNAENAKYGEKTKSRNLNHLKIPFFGRAETARTHLAGLWAKLAKTSGQISGIARLKARDQTSEGYFMKKNLLILVILATHLRSGAQTVNPAEKGDQAFCRQKWTLGSGVNKRMLESCLDDLKDSAEQVARFETENATQPWFKLQSKPGCQQRWTKDGFTQNDMLIYCYRQEQAAVTELKYRSGLKSFNSGLAEACYKVWNSKLGLAFGKTFECYEKRTEVANFALPKVLSGILEITKDSRVTSTRPH